MFPEIARDEVFRLETRRLWLRWPRAADAAVFRALANDWEVARWTAALPHPYALADAEQFIRDSREANLRGSALRLALTLKSGERDVVGVIGVEAHEGRPMLGYWLGRPFWGQGLMSEAVAAMVHAFFLFSDGEELYARVSEENAASRGVLEKRGFVEVERLAAGPGRQAENPSLVFALRRHDWQARGGKGEGAHLPPGLCSFRS
jgi:RimJ/RimL family protein N-acetyltransferase